MADDPQRQRAEPESDMTPMVDVTFLLLIFFLVTAAFALQEGPWTFLLRKKKTKSGRKSRSPWKSPM